MVAYFMKFETSRVKIIEADCSKNSERCCREVFIHWLDSKEGISPKTWEVLLKTLSEITDLTRVTEQIKIDIEKVTNLLLFYTWI